MKTYVTFGQSHAHNVNGKTFDKNCVAVIDCKDARQGRELAFEYFGSQFCFEYHEEKFDMELMKYFPKGLIAVN